MSSLTPMFFVLVALTMGVFGAFSYTFVKERSFALLPSIGWFCFMNVPFLLAWGYFPEPYRSVHATGVVIVSALLLAADCGSFFLMKRRAGQASHIFMTDKFLNMVAWASTAALIGIAVYHLIAAQDIPLFDRLFTDGTPEEYLAQRNAFQRDLAVPFYMRYLINFNVYIFGSLALVLHWIKDRRRVTLALGLIIIFYSLLSTAKMPAMMATVIITALFASRACVKHDWLPKALFMCFLFGMSVFITFDYLAAPKIFKYYAHSPFTGGTADDPRRIDTLGDYIRSPEADEVSKQRTFLYRKFEYVVYRIFLTPIDVSDRWYQYFSYVQKEPEPLSALMGRATGSKLEHPSVRVGHWAYHEKFPSKYMPNVHAYGSLDADAFAYGGLKAVFIVALLFAMTRFAFAVFHTPNPIAETLHMTALVLMMAIPPSGSLPALLAPHGLLVLLGIMLVVWFATVRKNRLGTTR